MKNLRNYSEQNSQDVRIFNAFKRLGWELAYDVCKGTHIHRDDDTNLLEASYMQFYNLSDENLSEGEVIENFFNYVQYRGLVAPRLDKQRELARHRKEGDFFSSL